MAYVYGKKGKTGGTVKSTRQKKVDRTSRSSKPTVSKGKKSTKKITPEVVKADISRMGLTGGIVKSEKQKKADKLAARVSKSKIIKKEPVRKVTPEVVKIDTSRLGLTTRKIYKEDGMKYVVKGKTIDVEPEAKRIKEDIVTPISEIIPSRRIKSQFVETLEKAAEAEELKRVKEYKQEQIVPKRRVSITEKPDSVSRPPFLPGVKPDYGISTPTRKMEPQVHEMILGLGTKEGFEKAEAKASEYIPALTEVKRAGYEFGVKHPKIKDIIVPAALDITSGMHKDVRRSDKPHVEHIEGLRSEFAHIAPPEELRKAQEERIMGPHEKTLTFVGSKAVEKYTELEEKPLGIAAEAVMLYSGGYVLGGATKVGVLGAKYGVGKIAGRVASAVPGKFKRVKGTIEFAPKMVEPVVGAVFGKALISDIKERELYKDPEKLVWEYGLGFAGAAKGYRAPEVAYDIMRVRGMEKLPLESVMKPEVITGEKQFPMVERGATAKEVLTEFKKPEYKLPKEEPGEYGWHATPSKFGKEAEVKGVVTRRTDVPGLYVAPSVSPHFLRIPRKGPTDVPLFSRLFGESGVWSPTILRVKTKKIGRLPEKVRYTEKLAREFLHEKAVKGEAYLTPVLERAVRKRGGGTEIEAVVSPKTMLESKVGKYYVEVGGRRVPIQEYGVLDVGKVPKVKRGLKVDKIETQKVLEKMEYYRPETLGTIRLPKYKPVFKEQYKPSYEAPYKPPYEAPYKLPYEAPYKPLYEAPYKPPYKPPYEAPYKPPYEAPYKPPYKPPYEAPYEAPYKPPYEAPYKPPYKPPYEAPYKPPYEPPYEYVPPPLPKRDIKRLKTKKGKKAYLEQMHLIGDPMTALKAIGKGMEGFTVAESKPKVSSKIKPKDRNNMFISEELFKGVLPTKKSKSKRSKRSKAQKDMFDINI